MINLSEYEKELILLCKGQLQKEYPFTGRWCNTLKPLYIKHYSYNPDENNNYNDYLIYLFDQLFDVFMKIKEENGSENVQLKEIFNVTFYKRIAYDEELPVERAIHKLCGLIQSTSILNKYGDKRFDLNLI